MENTRKRIGVGIIALLSACGGAVDEGDGGERNGSALGMSMFESNVAPVLEAACGSCHGASTPPLFLGSTPSDYSAMYAAIEANGYISEFASNRIMQKGEHAGGAGRALTASELEAGQAWLAQEMSDRAGSDNTGGDGSLSLASFASCMSYDDWKDSGLHTLAAQEAAGASKCQSCHGEGQGGVLLSIDQRGTFDFHVTTPRLIASVTATGIVPATIYESTGTRTGHPAYLLSADMKSALAAFVAKTNANCGF